ncbi:hypothetical protein KMZ29_26125 [Bradyrhizobium sediminis]|uniref:HTH domain-containing protein n=1 Tax=Bradyrhizobium sediminis TaxID=2840469 RepID=A0A975NEI6_9BRAD|nr:hypothetical protein [Bradyrhizobium sediminis]QWG13106.1 hypothetical protein KMZ29_26125 [Bradyrhizobium sediminis]
MSGGQPPEKWPLWLSDEIENLAIWSAEYDAAPSNWLGHGMSRADRANNLLARLLAEPRLETGDIAFVVHSFGGLVFAQMLRIASERAEFDAKAGSFLKRISRVTFLGTPHRGADLATIGGKLSFVSRLSAASLGLARNDPDLRDLNEFFRQYVSRNGIDTQSLIEGRSTSIWGLVVKPDSAGDGTLSIPIVVDADHFELTAPTSRQSEIYIHIRNQLKKPIGHRRTLVADANLLEGIAQNSAASAATLTRIEEKLSSTSQTAHQKPLIPSYLVDGETIKRITRLRQMRFFEGSTHLEDAERLASELLSGELVGTSVQVKADALAWCARLLSAKTDRSDAQRLLGEAKRLLSTEAVAIAGALLLSYEGNEPEALKRLAEINSNDARAASLIIVINSKGGRDPLKWFDDAGLSIGSIAPDGKFFLLKRLIDAGAWEGALKTAEALTDNDFREAPVLAYVAASARLASTAPTELKAFVAFQPPFEVSPIPLDDTAASMEQRRKARELFERAAEAAAGLGLLRTSRDAADRALWIALRDPTTRGAALGQLERSMRDPAEQLRRLPLALEFGLKLDLQAVEREIDRQDALSDGNSDVAVARISIALTKGSPKEGADYIAKYRDRLIKHLNPSFVYSMEIELLARSGQADLAEQKIVEWPNGEASESERDRLRRLIAEARGANPVEAREVEFRRTDSLTDLANLVERLNELEEWGRLAPYAATFFDRTRGLSACRIYAQTMFETKDYEGVLQLLNQHPDFVAQSPFLEAIRAWSFYRAGDINASRQAIEKLRARRDEANDRILFVSIAISSGDWTSLNSFIEEEWAAREKRSAVELLQAGQLAVHVGSSRARELIFEAASRAPDDPAVLTGCYGAAISSGWESDETARWLERAADLSGDDGPVQRFSLKQMLDLDPDWQQREKRTWEQLNAGDIPIFAAGHLLRRSVFQIYLIPAIANSEATDPRRRSVVYAYSGARQFFRATAKSAVLDPTTIISLAVTGALDKAFNWFDKIVIPHATLGWLFEEKQKLQFHQPRKIVEAREIKSLLESGHIVRFEGTAVVDRELASEVGDDLAAFIAEAMVPANDGRQRVVVRPWPVHRIGSLMEEEADLTAYSGHLSGCLELVAALAQQGQLTQAEDQRARAYFKLRERPWPTPVQIQPGATLFLDELTVTYFQHLRLLGKIKAAGFTAVASPSELLQGDAFVRHEDLTNRASELLEQIRKKLAEGISSGKVQVAPQRSLIEDDGVARLQQHPTFELMSAADMADVVVIDDRHFNQHGNISGSFGTRPVWSSYDIISFMSSDDNEFEEYVTALRRAGFAFVPLRAEELSALVARTSVLNGRMVETAELKAIRENLLLARMSESLAWPKEQTWLGNTALAFAATIKDQWVDGVDEVAARARAAWLLEQFDIRHWAPSYGAVGDIAEMKTRYRNQVLSLAMQTSKVSYDTKQKYWRWYEEAVLEPLRLADPELYTELSEDVKSIVEDGLRRVEGQNGA